MHPRRHCRVDVHARTSCVAVTPTDMQVYVCTQILVKNRDGDVVRTTPVRVTTAHHLSVLRKDKHESKQFVLGNEYEIEVVVYDKDENPIYPSEVGNLPTAYWLFVHAFLPPGLEHPLQDDVPQAVLRDSGV